MRPSRCFVKVLESSEPQRFEVGWRLPSGISRRLLWTAEIPSGSQRAYDVVLAAYQLVRHARDAICSSTHGMQLLGRDGGNSRATRADRACVRHAVVILEAPRRSKIE